MNRVTKRIRFGAGTIFLAVFSIGLAVPLIMSGQTSNTAAEVASAVLPLPDSLRAGATVVSHGGGDKFTVLKKGTNDTVCIREPNEGQGRHYQNGKIFWTHCYNELIFAVIKRRAELEQESLSAGKPVDAKTVGAALDSEVKSGKLKLPAHPTIGFQMMGPLSGYNPATNSVSSQIEAWQMVIIPYATGATLSLPEVPTKGMPWVMNSGAVMAHIMVEHDMAAMPQH